MFKLKNKFWFFSYSIRVDKKINILNLYIEIKDNNEKFIDYLNKYSNYLSKIPLNSFTKSVIDHKF